jgi:uncharacterized protein YutD
MNTEISGLKYNATKKIDCAILVVDLALTDFKNFFKIKRTNEIILNCCIQIIVSLYIIRKYFNIWHHDLHYGNILVKKVKKGGYWRYIINGKKIDIPNLGYIFILWDFGYARIPNFIENPKYDHIYKKKINPLEDYIDVVNNFSNYGFSNYNQIGEIFSKSLINIGVLETISLIGDLIGDLIGENKGKLIKTYNTDIKIKLPENLKFL